MSHETYVATRQQCRLTICIELDELTNSLVATNLNFVHIQSVNLRTEF